MGSCWGQWKQRRAFPTSHTAQVLQGRQETPVRSQQAPWRCMGREEQSQHAGSLSTTAAPTGVGCCSSVLPLFWIPWQQCFCRGFWPFHPPSSYHATKEFSCWLVPQYIAFKLCLHVAGRVNEMWTLILDLTHFWPKNMSLPRWLHVGTQAFGWTLILKTLLKMRGRFLKEPLPNHTDSCEELFHPRLASTFLFFFSRNAVILEYLPEGT